MTEADKRPVQLIDPRQTRGYRTRFRREIVPLLERVNSLYVASGRWPARAWALVTLRDLRTFNSFSTDFKLMLGELEFKHLSLVQAQCVTYGVTGDLDALYLLELTDDRGVLSNKWFQCPTHATAPGYNCRAPAYSDNFYVSTLNGSQAWTWSAMVADMWKRAVEIGLLNAFPGLPTTPAGTPDDWWTSGVDLWQAICNVLEHVGMTVACDLRVASPYTIVQLGAADAALTRLQSLYAEDLEDDLDWQELGSGRVPKRVVVFFGKRNEHYGTEETVRRDSLQWRTPPFYSVSVDAPARFSTAKGVHHVWEDFTVRYDADGNPMSSDVGAAQGLARNRAAEYYEKLFYSSTGYMTQTYAGALPFKVGSLVNGVHWTMGGRSGWRTTIVRGPNPPFQELVQ